MGNDYRHLQVDRLIETADRLASRIVGRFPAASLGKIAGAVSDITRSAVATAEKINRPNWWLRGGLIGLAVLVLVGAVVVALALREQTTLVTRVMEALRLVPLYLGAIVVFFWTLEVRFKRGAVVQAIYELRGLAHIIDMHQLSKDPECPSKGDPAYATPEAMTQYLHYCSEMLAILSKIGQLYVEDFHDGTTLASVDQFEQLTTGLSQKIWQKLMILERIRRKEEKPADACAAGSGGAVTGGQG
jgi:hypothetical protein